MSGRSGPAGRPELPGMTVHGWHRPPVAWVTGRCGKERTMTNPFDPDRVHQVPVGGRQRRSLWRREVRASAGRSPMAGPDTGGARAGHAGTHRTDTRPGPARAAR